MIILLLLRSNVFLIKFNTVTTSGQPTSVPECHNAVINYWPVFHLKPVRSAFRAVQNVPSHCQHSKPWGLNRQFGALPAVGLCLFNLSIPVPVHVSRNTIVLHLWSLSAVFNWRNFATFQNIMVLSVEMYSSSTQQGLLYLFDLFFCVETYFAS